MGAPLTATVLLTAESLAVVEAMGPLDVLVGVPVCNHARSIARLLEALAAGLQQSVAPQRGALLVLNAGSQDDAGTAVRTWLAGAPAVPPVRWLEIATPRRGHALLALFAAAQALGVAACAFVDADLTGATPAWIPALVQPILEQTATCVLPVYTRPLSDGTLTTNLLAPVTRALYGKRVHEVIGGCAGVAPALAGTLLDHVWQADHSAGGVDLLLTTQAVATGATVAEARLGPKQVAGGWGQPDLATTLVRTVGALFGAMERFHERWDAVQGSVPLTPPAADRLLSPAPGAHVDRMVYAFRMGLKDLLPVWEQIMPEDTLADLYPLGVGPAEEFQFPGPVWARAVFDFALAFHDRRLPREHLLRALAPLYLGRAAAFLLEARGAAPAGFDFLLERVGRAFEEAKGDLRFRWR